LPSCTPALAMSRRCSKSISCRDGGSHSRRHT
jgi:hypothetical protein